MNRQQGDGDDRGTKLARVRAALDGGDPIRALRIAAAFPRLGRHRDAIQRAASAALMPQTYRDMGYDPDQLIVDGVAAMRERWGW